MKYTTLSSALILSIAVVGCGPTPRAASITQTETLPATTAEVARKDLVGYSFFDGKVFAPAGTQSDILSPYDLPVDKVFVSVGQRVGKGAPLVRLTMPGAKESLTMAEANRASARTAYNAAVSGHSDQVTSAQAALKEARAAEQAARQDVASGGSSDVEGATQARMEAERELSAAIAERDSSTWAERQALSIADEYVSDARSGANQGILRSPISGTVVKVEAKAGNPATARQLLVSIVNVDKVQIQGTVPPNMAKEVQKGSRVLIALDGPNSDPFDGTVTDISVLPPAAGQSSSGYLAVIAFDNHKGLVLPGVKIKRLGLKTGSVQDALVVPAGAIAKTKEGTIVAYVKDGSNWVERPVETGLTDGALIEIKSGVKEGEVVRVQATTVAL